MVVKLVKLARNICENNLEQILQLNKYKRELDGHTYDYWGKEHVLKELPRKWDSSYLAFDNDKLIGFMISYLKSPDELRMSKICVLAKYRNLGIGTLLFKKFIEYAKENNIKKATTCTANFNHGMQRFLERNNFTRTFTWESLEKITYYNYEMDLTVSEKHVHIKRGELLEGRKDYYQESRHRH